MSEEQDRLRRQLETNLAQWKAAGDEANVKAVEERLAGLDAEFKAAAKAPDVVASTEPDVGTGRYEDRTLTQLRAVAESKGIAHSGLNKDDLIAAIRGA